jgi:hypothetical protein
MKMLSNFIESLSHSNPQMFRELKKQLNLKSIGIAIAVNLAVQLIILVYFSPQIPVDIY